MAKACGQVAKESKVSIIPIVQAVDLAPVVGQVNVPVWVQHLDPYPPGPYTGWISSESVIQNGGRGTLLNHSEHSLPPGTIKQVLAKARGAVGAGFLFEVMVCVKTLGQMKRLARLKPNYLGYEVSELIGTKTSITDALSPRTLKHAVEIAGEIPLIIGAGIHKAEDLVKSRQLGARGALISSAVVLAKDPRQKLLELVKGLKT